MGYDKTPDIILEVPIGWYIQHIHQCSTFPFLTAPYVGQELTYFERITFKLVKMHFISVTENLEGT